MNIINVHHLEKKFSYYRKEAGLWNTIKALFYRKRLYSTAVADISFTISEGEIVGFLGPNGAGKTTTLKMLSGILYRTSGDINVLGFDPEKRESAFQKQFGIVLGQKNQLAPLLTPMDNFLLFKEFCEVSNEDFENTFNELVDLLEIRHVLDIQTKKLSLGQRMKCELVAALLHNPRILFLDEPSIGLDVVSQKNIREFIKKYNKKNKTTIILTSHYMDDIKDLCERVIIINHGKIIYDGKLNELISKYATSKIIEIRLSTAVTCEQLEEYGTVEEYEEVRASIKVPHDQVKKIATDMMNSNLPIEDIIIEEISVDEIIRHIFQESKDIL